MDHLQKSLRGILHLPRAIVTEPIIPLLVVDLNGRKLSSLHIQQSPASDIMPRKRKNNHFFSTLKTRNVSQIMLNYPGSFLKTIVLRIPDGYSGHSI